MQEPTDKQPVAEGEDTGNHLVPIREFAGRRLAATYAALQGSLD
jgi:hypothetical protein